MSCEKMIKSEKNIDSYKQLFYNKLQIKKRNGDDIIVTNGYDEYEVF